MQKKRSLSATLGLGLGIVLLTDASSYAATSSGTMPVSATVVSSCTFGTSTTLAFPANISTLATAVSESTAGALSVTCNSGAAWSMTFTGSGNGTVSQPKMKSGTNTLNYNIYTTSAHSTAFPTAGTTIGGTGTGSAQSQAVYGQIPSGQALPPAGAYTDTATFTISY